MAVGGEERQTWAKSKVKRIIDKEAEQFSSLSMIFNVVKMLVTYFCCYTIPYIKAITVKS